MEITIFKDIVLNIILIIFPILVYFLLVVYKDDITKKYNDILLNISLLTSLYLCLRFGTITSNNKILLFCNVPIIISFIKGKPLLAIFLSLINIIYSYQIDNVLLIITLIKYLSYLILYLVSKKRKLSVNGFILSSAVLQGFFLSFEYFFLEVNSSLNDIVIMLLLVFIYYFMTFITVYIFKLIDKVQNLNKTIKLLEKDKKIKDALFKLTHEIKNPLAVCKGYLEMIDFDKREKAEKYVVIMQEEINRSLNIMTDFIQLNKIKIEKKRICINDLLDDIYNSFKLVAKSKNIKLIYKDSNNDIYIDGDYDRIKQVLVNLIKNSIEAINENGIIEIINKKFDDFDEIFIKDNGMGMSEETLSKLKEIFYTTKENGTGLGVSLSNEIIEAHGGSLTFKSSLNKGTTAQIRLPI